MTTETDEHDPNAVINPQQPDAHNDEEAPATSRRPRATHAQIDAERARAEAAEAEAAQLRQWVDHARNTANTLAQQSARLTVRLEHAVIAISRIANGEGYPLIDTREPTDARLVQHYLRIAQDEAQWQVLATQREHDLRKPRPEPEEPSHADAD